MLEWDCGNLFGAETKEKGGLIWGAPGVESLTRSAKIIQRATEFISKTDAGGTGWILQYGPSAGSHVYCQEVARFLSRQYNDTVKSSEILSTTGATNGLHILTSLLVDHGGPVFVEDPTYFLAISAIRDDMGMNVVPTPAAPDGLDLEKLEELLKTHCPKTTTTNSTAVQQQLGGDSTSPLSGSGHGVSSGATSGRFWGMIYIVTVYNNPRSHCYSSGNCKRLIQLARQYNILIICDDVYNLVHWDQNEAISKRLLQYDKELPGYQGHVISNGSFSKLLGPGLRCGWVEGPENIIKRLTDSALITSSGSLNHYTSQLIAAALVQGWVDDHIAHSNKLFLEKRDALEKVFKKHLNSGIKVQTPKGGYFYWLVLSERVDGVELANYLRDNHRISVLPGSRTSPTQSFKNCIRISVSFYDREVIVGTVEKLCQAIKQFTDQLE